MDLDEVYMERVLELAKKGWGTTNPNPLVAAIIVKDGKIISEGFHQRAGWPHAEVVAINNACQSVKGAAMYVNLEPCSHYGRTPPCVNSIVEAGIKKVVIGMQDPNPKISGRGIQMLKEAGIEVKTDVLLKEACKLNEIFVKYITQKKPFVIVKWAMTLDGKIASYTGDSKWISSEEAREYVHKIRKRCAAVLVGINTVIKDNPYLNVRLKDEEHVEKIKIIIDSKGRIPESSNVICSCDKCKVIYATTSMISKEKEEFLIQRGANVLKIEDKTGKVDLNRLMDILYEMGIDSVLIEGGSEINWCAFESGIVDKVLVFISPKILGGKEAVTAVGGAGKSLIKESFKLKEISYANFAEDILIEGYLRK